MLSILHSTHVLFASVTDAPRLEFFTCDLLTVLRGHVISQGLTFTKKGSIDGAVGVTLSVRKSCFVWKSWFR